MHLYFLSDYHKEMIIFSRKQTDINLVLYFLLVLLFTQWKRTRQFEIDPDKAREALQQLDQQLQDLSQKQVTPPKIKESDVKLTRDQTTEEEIPEFSGSFLAFATAALFLFTIFYNILYITVIEPSIDGVDPTPTAALKSESQSPQAAAGVQQLLPSAPGT